MKKLFKINMLHIVFALLLPLAALAAVAAEGPPGKGDGKGPSAEERKAPMERMERMEYCKANPDKCRAEKKARMEQMCKDNPERCKDLQARHEKRLEECKAHPEKCHAEKKARMERHEQMCKDNPERCKAMKEKMDQRRAEKKAHFEQRFKGADTDGNGMVSRVEAEKSLPRLARQFERFDTNQDGQVSRDEMAAAFKARFERRKGRAEPTKI